MITLKKTHFDSGTAFAVPGWISNGRWGVRLARVSNAALCTTVESLTAAFGVHHVTVKDAADEIERCYRHVHSPRAWQVSAWMYDGAGRRVLRAVIARDTGEIALFDDRYLQVLEMAPGGTMYGADAGSVFTDADHVDQVTAMIMPFRDRGIEFPRPTSTA